jgi:uncharacterized repeat protein (TIGR02543 family)
MKKNAIRILSLLLVVMTLVGVISLPVSASIGYPMNYTIYYKAGGKLLGQFSGSCDGTERNNVRVPSPSYDGYLLSNYKDSTVTGSMITWNFPASNYVRHGTGSYTVYYELARTVTVRYLYGDSGRSAAGNKTATGKKGDQYYISSPRITGYTPNKFSVTGYYPDNDISDTVYYYENTYTISYNANGGSGAPASQTKAHFTPLKLSTLQPRRTGYTFLGWSTSASATTASYSPGATYSSNGNTTLYAVWSTKTYSITFNANGGSGGPTSQTKYHGIKLLLSSIEPTRSGYTFLGWGVSSSSTSPTYQPGDWYNSNVSRTLYAVWQKNAPTSYTVSFDANGGSGAPSSQTKTKDVTLTLSSTKPTRSGYTFLGWATSAGATSASYQPGGSYTANASITLYAVWTCNHASTKTVWDTGCKWRKVCNNCGVTVSSGITHGPYTHGDWVYYSGSQHSRYKTCIHGDYATTENESHNTSNRYEQYSASQHKKYSHCADCNSTVGSVSYEGHTFTSTTSNGQTIFTCSQCGYTQTTAQTYTVSYNANGGSNAPASQTKVHGLTLTLSSTIPYRFNYEFLGWSASSSATTATYTAGGSYTGNVSVTLYAVWRYKPATYTVSYDANGGTGAPSRQTKTYGVTLTLTTLIPTRRNYSFVGWSKDRNATSASYTAGGSYTDNADVTLYAVWRYDPETYTIRYDANGGTGAPPSQTKTYGVPLTLSAVKPTRAGYDFLGWATSRNATVSEYAPGERYTDEAGVTLYAVWRYIPKTYEVKYDVNGGGNTPASQTKTEDVTLILTFTIPTRYGYTFKGWATSSSATLATYQAGGSYTANESVTLYAVWEINTYTVSFDANGGSNAPNSQKKTHGQNLILTVAIPTRPNHVFLGWAADSSATSIAYVPGATYTAEEDVTLYAVWQERNYDFSVSDLTVTPDEIEQYGKVTVKFRVDNWDRNLPYANVPVEVLLNGEVIYSTTVNFSAYGVQNIVFGLNVGASLGTQTLVARINWADHESETRTGNNSTSATCNVKKVVETSTSVVSVNGEYTEGSQVISSFFVGNEGSSDILPEDNVSFDFLVYYLDGGKVKTVSQQTWDKVVIPANGRNLVYFKWTIPADSAGTTYFCKGTITHKNAAKEQNSDNNTTEYAVVATDYVSSQTPNTRFEKNAPAGYSPNATSPTAKSGSATWNMWVYEGGRLVLKSYGITVGNTTPTVTPGSGCLTAEKVGATWKMKSGYGITLNWNPALVAKSGYIMPDTDAYTEAQSVYATFPEFDFSMASEKYRTLEKVGGAYGFIANPNADKNERVHFIPVYVQDGSYTVSVTATQIWTPAGMITAIRNANTLTIDGTVYDDYYQGNK